MPKCPNEEFLTFGEKAEDLGDLETDFAADTSRNPNRGLTDKNTLASLFAKQYPNYEPNTFVLSATVESKKVLIFVGVAAGQISPMALQLLSDKWRPVAEIKASELLVAPAGHGESGGATLWASEQWLPDSRCSTYSNNTTSPDPLMWDKSGLIATQQDGDGEWLVYWGYDYFKMKALSSMAPDTKLQLSALPNRQVRFTGCMADGAQDVCMYVPALYHHTVIADDRFSYTGSEVPARCIGQNAATRVVYIPPASVSDQHFAPEFVTQIVDAVTLPRWSATGASTLLMTEIDGSRKYPPGTVCSFIDDRTFLNDKDLRVETDWRAPLHDKMADLCSIANIFGALTICDCNSGVLRGTANDDARLTMHAAWTGRMQCNKDCRPIGMTFPFGTLPAAPLLMTDEKPCTGQDYNCPLSQKITGGANFGQYCPSCNIGSDGTKHNPDCGNESSMRVLYAVLGGFGVGATMFVVWFIIQHARAV